MVYNRDVESKDFSFDSQLLVPKIVRESNFQAPKIIELSIPTPTSHPWFITFLKLLAIGMKLLYLLVSPRYSVHKAAEYPDFFHILL